MQLQYYNTLILQYYNQSEGGGTVVLNALGAMMEGGCAVLARLFRPSVRSGTSSLELLSDSEKLAFEAKRFWDV